MKRDDKLAALMVLIFMAAIMGAVLITVWPLPQIKTAERRPEELEAAKPVVVTKEAKPNGLVAEGETVLSMPEKPENPKADNKLIFSDKLILSDKFTTDFRLDYHYENYTLGYWLMIKPEVGDEYRPETVRLESSHEPVVTKVGDKWVIKFKKD